MFKPRFPLLYEVKQQHFLEKKIIYFKHSRNLHGVQRVPDEMHVESRSSISLDAWVAPNLDPGCWAYVRPTLTSKKHLEKEINPRKILIPLVLGTLLVQGFSFLSLLLCR